MFSKIFKSKKVDVCLICNAEIEQNPVILKYRYGSGEGIIGEAKVCHSCADELDNDEVENGEDE